MRSQSPRCPLCDSNHVGPALRVRGYADGSAFDVRPCRACGSASVAHAGAALAPLYDAIYRQRSVLPGYERYERFAQAVASAADPLAALKALESSYRFVAEWCEALAAPRSRVLEVGAGLGYLTYALRSRGLDAWGLDLSSHAVQEATSRFGPFYRAATLAELASGGEQRFDVLVMTELIEHVPDPVGLLEEALAVLSPAGRMLITTPNRDAYPESATWCTEQPPIHLHWLSARGVTAAAERVGLECSLGHVDSHSVDVPMAEANDRPPILDRTLAPWRPSIAGRIRRRLQRAFERPLHASGSAPLRANATIFAVLRERPA